MRSVLVLGIVAALAFGTVIAGTPTVSNRLLGNYYAIQKSLASDSLDGVAKSAAEIAKISRNAAPTAPEAKAQLLALADSAAKMNTTDLQKTRNGFGDLSDKLIAYLKASNAPANPPYQYYCSMVKKSWLQPEKGVRNPYYGKSMLTCGELVQTGKPAETPGGHHHP